MKRVIKFRIWLHGSNCYCSRKVKFFRDLLALNLNSAKTYEIEQFTGLTDKNGKEIFEGDILKTKLEGEEAIEKVVFQNGSFVHVNVLEEFDLDTIEFLDLYDEFHVIGNIHENPELLNACFEPIPLKGPAQCIKGHWLGSKQHPLT